MRTDVLDVGFDDITMDEAVESAMRIMDKHGASWVVTPNPEIVWLCRKDEKLKRAVMGAKLVLADGIGIIYGARILGRPLKSKLPGIDFAEKVIERIAVEGKSIYFLGSKPGVAEKAAENLRIKYPGLKVIGYADGYFKDSDPVVEKINSVSPDMLLVCLGAPKQEYWMLDNAKRLDVGLMAGLGGSLDVFAGTVERAPDSWRRHGLEWLYRLKNEPKRIGRTMKLPLFLIAVVIQRIRGM